MRKALRISTLAAAITLAGPAFAGDTGWYAGVGFGHSKTNDWISKSDAAGAVASGGEIAGITGTNITSSAKSDDSDSSWKLFAGYKVNKYLAAELGYVDLGKNTASASQKGTFSDGSGSFNGSIDLDAKGEAKAFLLDAVGRYDVAPIVTLFVKGGLYRSDVKFTVTNSAYNGIATGSITDKVSEKTTGLHYALGADFNVTENIVIRAEWERLNRVKLEDQKVDIDNLSLSAIYQF